MKKLHEDGTNGTAPDGLKSFLEMSEHGSPYSGGPPRSPRRPVIDLMTYAEAKNVLNITAPWRLDPKEARDLESALGYAPVGGWSTLVALVAGTGALAATVHGFYPKQTVRSWQDRTDDEVRITLGEAFTRFLVPPVAAAGLFVVLKMNPLWGLRVAKHQGGAGPAIFDEDAARFFPAEELSVAELGSFGAIAGFMAGLATLSPGVAYPLDTLGPFFGACAATARGLAMEAWEPRSDTIPIFLPGGDSEDRVARVFDSTAEEILDVVLVPAGLVRRLEDGRFVVHEALREVDVGGLSVSERQGWLGFVTATEPRFLVA